MTNNLSIDTGLVHKILTGFIRSEVQRAGFTRGVVNLSGGIDSAVTYALAVEALEPHNVLALRLPASTSSSDSLGHSQLLIDQFGSPSLTIPIGGMLEAAVGQATDVTDMRKGNILARLRMILAYDQSEAFKGLVIGTGNKTELLLGYTTLYGDSACAINPIGDLYKTQLRQLAQALHIPDVIIHKPPSADLWAGQTDEGELGFSYEEVDRLLYLLVDQRYRPEECVEAGFAQAFVTRVVERIRRNQFKRILPPVAKLSNRTVGYDFLYLRDWGT